MLVSLSSEFGFHPFVFILGSKVLHPYQLKHVLIGQGFSKIIGLKDLRREQDGRQFTPADLLKIESGSRITERLSLPIPAKVITAVMEIETWFLAETNHYTCIDDRLTKELIASKTTAAYVPRSPKARVLRFR